jgi:hypothetical protein
MGSYNNVIAGERTSVDWFKNASADECTKTVKPEQNPHQLYNIVNKCVTSTVSVLISILIFHAFYIM